MFDIIPCKTRAAVSVKLKRRMSLNMERLARHFDAEVSTPVVIVIKDFGGVIVHDFGDLLFKTWTEKKDIRQAAKKIYAVGLKNKTLK